MRQTFVAAGLALIGLGFAPAGAVTRIERANVSANAGVRPSVAMVRTAPQETNGPSARGEAVIVGSRLAVEPDLRQPTTPTWRGRASQDDRLGASTTVPGQSRRFAAVNEAGARTIDRQSPQLGCAP